MLIKIKVSDVTDQMFLRQALGEGTTEDGREIDITQIIGSGDLHFSIGEKDYLVRLKDILGEILNKEEKPTKKGV